MSDLDPYDLSKSRDMSKIPSAELAALREQNEKLWECVRAGDEYIASIIYLSPESIFGEWTEKENYYAARAALGKEKP